MTFVWPAGSGRRFRAYKLLTNVFVIDLGASLHEDTRILEMLVDNHLGHLAGLEGMSCYRDFYNDWCLQKLRTIYRIPPIEKCSRLVRRFFGE